MRLRLILLFSMSIRVCYGQQGIAASSQMVLVHTVDSILQGHVDRKLIPGAVVLINKDNRVIYHKAYGYARIYDRNFHKLDQPEIMTGDHLFDIASLTKVVGTTTSIMWLADRKRISLDDPVCKYIAAFNTTEKKRITIRNLLTHTSGLPEWYPLYYRAADRKETYALIASLPLQDAIGKQRKYSDLGFTVLGEIIEKVSGMPLEEFEQEIIFTPLGMTHTLYNPLQTGKFTRFAATSLGNPYEKRMVYDSSLGFTRPEIDPHSWNGWRNYVLSGEVNDGNAWYANRGVSGAAGLFSTADDLQHLVDMLLQGGMYNGRRFISASTIRQFLTIDQFKNGLGWMMDPANAFMKNGPAGSFGHTGFTGTSIAVIPKYKTSVILLVNRQQTGLLENGTYYNLNPVREQLFQAVLDYCSGKSE